MKTKKQTKLKKTTQRRTMPKTEEEWKKKVQSSHTRQFLTIKK